MAERSFPVQAGSLSAVLACGELRDLRVLGYRALDAVYVAVRDDRWNTVPGVISDVRWTRRGEGAAASWHVRHHGSGIDFEWRGSLEADDRELTFRLDGTARAEFETSRIGVCLLHPAELAGTAVRVTFPGSFSGGRTEATSFPARVSPGPVLTGATGLDYEAGPGARLAADVTGGLLETEDHRNWTDPGWKTYTPPLAEPAPRLMRPGDRVSQAVRLRGIRRPGALPAVPEAGAGPVDLRIGAADGVLPRVGVMLATGADEEMTVLALMRPGVLHAGLRPRGDWRGRLARASAGADRLGSGLSVALTGTDPAWLADCGRALAALLRPPVAVGVFAPPDGIAPPGCAEAVRRELRTGHHGVPVPVGGGSMLHFAELNRAAALDPDWDFVSFPVTAQAHHSGDRLVMGTILGQEPAVRSAAALAGGRPVVAAPVSLRPRVTPATAADPEDPRDPRESTQFGAAWLCASVIAMRAARMVVFLNPLVDASGVASATPAGDLGRLMAALAGLAGRAVLRVDTDRRRVAALAVDRPGRPPLLIAANLASEPVTIRLGARTWPLPGYGTVIAGE